MNEVATIPQQNTQITQAGPRPIYPHDFESAWRMATAIAKSGLAPKGIETPEAIFTAMQLGAEVGLSPMSALQNIAVVNGRPTIWGDAQLALVRASGLLESFEETLEGKDEEMKAVCKAKREGYSVSIGEFSVSDAKTAGLWKKSGPWTTNPKRMLKMRARAFALRDGFTDILKGIYSTEEARDITVIRETGGMSSTEELNKEFLNGGDNAVVINETKTESTDASQGDSAGSAEGAGKSSSATEKTDEKSEEHIPAFLRRKSAEEVENGTQLYELMQKLDTTPKDERSGAFVAANGQELFDKSGAKPEIAKQLQALGINVITKGEPE